MKEYEWSIPIWVILATSVLSILGFWALGYFLNSIGYFHREAEFNNQRDPLAKQVRRTLEIKEDLKNDNTTGSKT
jgi:hypothetical protein